MASKASGKLPVISFGLTALSALGFAWLARRVWGERSKWRFVYGFTWASTLAMLLTLMAVFPILNTKIVIHHFSIMVRDQSIQVKFNKRKTSIVQQCRIQFPVMRRVPIIV